MSLFSWIGQRIGLGANSQGFWGRAFGQESYAGENVTPQRAMQLSAV